MPLHFPKTILSLVAVSFLLWTGQNRLHGKMRRFADPLQAVSYMSFFVLQLSAVSHMGKTAAPAVLVGGTGRRSSVRRTLDQFQELAHRIRGAYLDDQNPGSFSGKKTGAEDCKALGQANSVPIGGQISCRDFVYRIFNDRNFFVHNKISIAHIDKQVKNQYDISIQSL